MGCGCNSNFSGQKKQCTCGRNAGGACQCNQRKLNASGKKYRCRNIYGGIYYSDKPCVNEYGGTTKQTNNPRCETDGKPCMWMRHGIECGRNCHCISNGNNDGWGTCVGKFGGKQNLQQRIKSNKARFSSFMGYSNKFPQVDTKKYGISDEHYFEFNSRVGHTAGINRTDMQEMDF